jgi:hypothetical protein
VAGDRIVAAAEAYAPASDAAVASAIAEVERVDDGVVIQRREEPLARAAQAGLSEISVPLDTGPMSPGRYVLRVRLDGAPPGSPGERSVPFEVVANP